MTSVYTFFGSIESLETVIESIKEKVLYYGADIKWKIDLVATDQEYTKKRVFTPIAPSLTDISDFNYTDSEIKSKSGQSCDIVIHRQTKQIKEEAAIEQSIMENIYLLKRQEDELRHLNELNIQSVKIKKLRKALIKAEEILKNIDTVHIPTKDFKKDKESLLIDKLYLLKKLKLSELRLNVREVELDALCSAENEANIMSAIEPTTVLPISEEYIISPTSNSCSISFTSERSISPYSRRSSIYSATEHNNIPSSPTEYNSSIQLSTDNILSTAKYDTSPTTEYNILPTTSEDYSNPSSMQTFPVASLSTLADRLLKSTQQQQSKNQTLNLPPERSFAYGKEKRKLSDHDPVKRKKPKTIKLTYKDQWTEDEDSQLLDQVQIFGIDNWEKVSKALLYRSSAECLRRFQQLTVTIQPSLT